MCTRPVTIRIRRKFTGRVESVAVPCGKCSECLRDYQNAWYVRFVQEFVSDYKAVFFTLTYNDTHIPKVVDSRTGVMYYSVCKSHVQNWIKRFRTAYEREFGHKIEFKYFITAEYGPRTGRPHYHGVIFHQNAKVLRKLFRDWQVNFGFVKYDDVWTDSPHGACKYVAKYCNKGFFESKFVADGFVDKVFHLVSNRLGFDYVLARRCFHRVRDGVNIPHFSYTLKGLTWNLEALRMMKARESVVMVDKYGVVRYKMPKYFKDRIYSNMQIVEKDGEIFYSFTASLLQSALSDYVRKESDALYLLKLAQIQSERRCSESEAVNILAMQECESFASREKSARISIENFYKKSIF